MPASPSHGSRGRSVSPQRDRHGRDRSRSPPKPWSQRKTKELSFYKKQGGGSMPQRPTDEEETAKERMERRARGEVPKRFGGTREQGVRNTMGNVAAPVASSVGSFKRSADPLDRLGVKGEDRRDRDDSGHRDDYGDRDRRRRDDERRERDPDRRRRDRDGDRDGDRPRDRDDRPHGRDDRRERDYRHPDRRGEMSGVSGGPPERPQPSGPAPVVRPGRMIEVIANDRMGRKVRVKCLPTDTVGDLKKFIAAQTGTSAQKIQLKKWYTAFKDHVTLQDYEINDGMSLEMY